MCGWAQFVLTITAVVWVVLFLTAGLVLVTWMVGKIADIIDRAIDGHRVRRLLRQK